MHYASRDLMIPSRELQFARPRVPASRDLQIARSLGWRKPYEIQALSRLERPRDLKIAAR
jgi:hypothetical protein